MSGPKCDEFELEQWRREQELERIRERERKRIEAEKKRRAEELRRQEQELKRKQELERIRLEQERKEKERLAEEKRVREKDSQEFNEQESEEFERLVESLYEQEEQQIVAQAIDEAMEEMGYDLIAAMQSPAQNEQHVEAKVFEFSSGTGIQIMEANGQVSMELVGIGNKSRVPSEEEQDYLVENMGKFCTLYTKLDEYLEKRGVKRVLNRYHQQPDKKYARIMDITHFEQKKEVETLQSVMKKNNTVSEHKPEQRKKLRRYQ